MSQEKKCKEPTMFEGKDKPVEWCNGTMREVCKVGDVQFDDGEGNFGVRPLNLYQCTSCKHATLE